MNTSAGIRIRVITETCLVSAIASRLVNLSGSVLYRTDLPDGEGHGDVAALLRSLPPPSSPCRHRTARYELELLWMRLRVCAAVF